MLTDFQNSFTFRLISKRVMKKIIKYHTTLQTRRYLVKCKCQETTDSLKQMSRLTINFNLMYYIYNVLANLCHDDY